jgi:nucleotide-binding universal stress UspA family protein
VVVAVDFSEESRKALQYAAAFAQQFGADITLLHVVEPLVCSADYGYGRVTNEVPNQILLRKAKSRLNRWAAHLSGSAGNVVTIVRTGVPSTEITRVAGELAADLIAMGTRAENSAAKTTTQKTAERVVRYAPCPVFVVHKKEEFAHAAKQRGSL